MSNTEWPPLSIHDTYKIHYGNMHKTKHNSSDPKVFGPSLFLPFPRWKHADRNDNTPRSPLSSFYHMTRPKVGSYNVTE